MNPALDHRSDSVVVRLARSALLAVALLAAAGWQPTTVASAQEPAPVPAAPSGMSDQDYLAYADRLQPLMEPSWGEQDGLYRAGDGSEPMVNANMLLSHAVAAGKGNTGPSRNDERARRIAARLISAPPFVEQPSPGPPGSNSQAHAPGWVNSTTTPLGSQHLVFDADVVDGLLHAWRARAALGLPQETSDAIVDRVSRTTHGPFWRFPAIRLNQINWYALMYAATAEMTGDPTLLREDFRQQVLRFTAPQQPDPERAGNFGPGLRFHYLPDRPAERRLNVDSAEYANIVFSFARFYEQARLSGMAPLPARDRRLLREWGVRILSGYWTHGGYLNWDTGLGFNRWHQTKKIGLSQQALIALASTEALQTKASQGPWAKWMFDRGLALFEQWSVRAGGVPPPVSFGVIRRPLGASSARLGVSRVQANAARAISAGLGSLAASPPPSLYAFDPDVGRLAVTTPAYNTAVVAVNQGAFPYGGHRARTAVRRRAGRRRQPRRAATVGVRARHPLGERPAARALAVGAPSCRPEADSGRAAACSARSGGDRVGAGRPRLRRPVPRAARPRADPHPPARAGDPAPLHPVVRRDPLDGDGTDARLRTRALRRRGDLPEHRRRRAADRRALRRPLRAGRC